MARGETHVAQIYGFILVNLRSKSRVVARRGAYNRPVLQHVQLYFSGPCLLNRAYVQPSTHGPARIFQRRRAGHRGHPAGHRTAQARNRNGLAAGASETLASLRGLRSVFLVHLRCLVQPPQHVPVHQADGPVPTHSEYPVFVTLQSFTTGLLARHVGKPDERTAALIYHGTLVLMTLFYNGTWWYAISRKDLVEDGADRRFLRRLTTEYALAPTLHLAALLVCLWSVPLSILPVILLYVYFALPRLSQKSMHQ